jgi:L-lactate permease
MPGYQEILIISAIVLGVIFLPRMMEPKKPTVKLIRPRTSLSGRWRLAIALSIVYPLFAAAVMQPWHTNPVAFGCIGLGPVLLGWLLFWVWRGFRRK